MSVSKAIVACAVLVLVSCSSSSGSNSVDSKALCSKCGECFAQDPYFQEGYCDPFWNGSSFDTASCISNADPAEIDGNPPNAAQLEKMSCSEFDSAI